MRLRPLSGRVRLAATVLWIIGAGLAGTTGVLALAHSRVAVAALYAVVATVLALLAVTTHRGSRSSEALTLVLLASQVVGMIGAAWEIGTADGAGLKARHLEELGINHRLALAGNLLFSLAASAVFVRAVLDGMAGRRTVREPAARNAPSVDPPAERP